MARARIEGITKPIRLEQLAEELGTNQVFGSGSPIDAVEAEVPLATLEAAVAAHVPDDLFGEPQEHRDLTALRIKAQAVFAGADTFTAPQIQKAVAGLILKATARRS